MTRYLIVLTTTADEAVARRLAEQLVVRRLAACVQIAGPIRSVYRWKDAVESAVEFQVSAKTREDLYTEIERAIGELNPYEVPEIMALPVVAGSRPYLEWLEQQLIPPSR